MSLRPASHAIPCLLTLAGSFRSSTAASSLRFHLPSSAALPLRLLLLLSAMTARAAKTRTAQSSSLALSDADLLRVARHIHGASSLCGPRSCMGAVGGCGRHRSGRCMTLGWASISCESCRRPASSSRTANHCVSVRQEAGSPDHTETLRINRFEELHAHPGSGVHLLSHSPLLNSFICSWMRPQLFVRRRAVCLNHYPGS